MGLLSIFQRNKQTAAKPAKSGRGGKTPARQAPPAHSANFAGTPSPTDVAEAVREARARARRRLMGATVLLLAGVIGFPLLFETQPRPIPVDLPIEIPSRTDAAHANGAPAALPLAAGPAASGAAAESVTYDVRPASAARSTPAPAAFAAAPSAFASLAAALTSGGSHVGDAAAPASAAAASNALSRADVNPAMPHGAKKPPTDVPASGAKPPTIALTSPPAASKPVAAHAATAAPKPTASAPADSGAAAAALLAGGAAPNGSDAAAGASRFVVQIGAFADDAKVREARGKVEQLGLKTYTQAVDTPGGKRVRVRVGPFATKAEADRTAAKIKADGLPAAVLVL